MQLMNKHQHKTVKAHIETELRAIENNPKSTKQVKDRVVKLLGKASALLQEVSWAGHPPVSAACVDLTPLPAELQYAQR